MALEILVNAWFGTDASNLLGRKNGNYDDHRVIYELLVNSQSTAYLDE